MYILGIGCAFEHDPSACLLKDGEIIAAADEERFIRKKHAVDELPIRAIEYCLKTANITADQVDRVAFPWSFQAYEKHLWRFIRRNFMNRPSHAFKALVKKNSRKRDHEKKLYRTLRQVGISQVSIEFVEHHLAHAASSYCFSGFPSSAILTIDGKGEFTTTLIGEANESGFKVHEEFINPDSLGLFYSTMTDYLGFSPHDGEYKVMGMSGYGDASQVDLSDWVSVKNGKYRVDEQNIWVPRSLRYQGRRFSKNFIDRWGPPREGDALSEPYTHIAASTQAKLEEVVLSIIDNQLKPILERHEGRLCFAGGTALNVRLNRKLIEHPSISQLWVQPAAHDSGTSLGAAAYLGFKKGMEFTPMEHSYYGPEYSDEEIKEVLDKFHIQAEHSPDITETTAKLLAEGQIVGWFQGRMEWGPRALGNRSILAHPAHPGISDEVNERIKFREVWRPFCPSILKENAPEILGSEHDSPFMTFSFSVQEEWKDRIPEVVHVDGTCRPQCVSEKLNPRYYQLIQKFKDQTGLPVLLNTSLNRRGEPMVCSPEDALEMFYASGLEYIVLGDYLIKKSLS